MNPDKLESHQNQKMQMKSSRPPSMENESVSYGIFCVIANNGLRLTYAIPQEFKSIKMGQLCLLPLKSGKNKKTVVGVFLECCEKPSFVCAEVLEFFPENIEFMASHLNFIQWVSEYYATPFPRCLHLLAPGFLWNVEKIPSLKKRINEVLNPIESKKKKEEILRTNIDLTPQQESATNSILENAHRPTLLYGVTGSGKTEVYLKLAQKIIQSGKKVLMMVPEIALTPQMSARFRAVFSDELVLLHSGLSANEYMREWLKIYFQKAKIVLGVRTAIFCPLQDIGLIIVDEEHDTSYKASELPCTQSRDLAIVRAKMEQAICLLGSATPSLESYANVQSEKYNYVEMTEKFSVQKTQSYIVNAKEEFSLQQSYQKKNHLKSSFVEFEETGLCPTIINALKENKEKNEQSMILINRRGFVNYALCSSCATPLSCPYCSVSTTLHDRGKREMCHYCGYTTPTRKSCPSCGGESFFWKGLGTQNVEEKLKETLPHFHISRLDRDVLTSHSRLSQIIEDFRSGHTDCLVGTQLLAKGHDFANVTLIAILHVEDSLFLPDFRASERTFQLLTQSMGRVGRGNKPGRVFLQSFVLSHPVVEFALKNDVHGFLKREIVLRQLAWLPPFSRQALCEVKDKSLEKAKEKSEKLKNFLIQQWKKENFSQEQIRLVGPTPSTIEKINSIYRFHLCVSFSKNIHPKLIFPQSLFAQKDFADVLKIDVDPLSYL